MHLSLPLSDLRFAFLFFLEKHQHYPCIRFEKHQRLRISLYLNRSVSPSLCISRSDPNCLSFEKELEEMQEKLQMELKKLQEFKLVESVKSEIGSEILRKHHRLHCSSDQCYKEELGMVLDEPGQGFSFRFGNMTPLQKAMIVR